MSSELIKSEIKLTIGMLVSNHIGYIRKAMEALKPLLEAVPSELVVIDTMGDKTDGSIDVVREYTDQIYPFTWCDDFSAARNECIKYARGEWFLYQDDDEWFDDVTEFIEFFKSGECEKYYSGYYYTRDYMADGSYSMGIAGRMIRRTKDTKFVGKVHETFNETFAPNKEFSCFTHHYGYAYVDDDAAKKKQDRNLTILKKELAEVGYDPKICAQITQELMQREETSAQGVEFAKDAVIRARKAGVLTDSSTQWMLTAIVRHYTRENNYETVRCQAEYIEQHYKLSQLAKMTLAATVAGTAFSAGEDVETISRVNQYLEQWDWKQKHEEEALLQTQLDFPRFYNESYYYRMLYMAAVSCNHLGQYEKANAYWKRMPWKAEGFDGSVYASDMNTTVKGLKKEKEEREQAEKKRVLFELCDMLFQAGEAAGQYMQQGAFNTMIEFLAQMQETAILLGGEVDRLLGESNREVPILEQYCEKVWQCSQSETVEEAEVYLAEAQALLTETKNMLQEDTKKKKVVVFLPYKASMWDSLESIWKAASEDKDCTAYVVPIPYYDKNPDGSFGEMHYEIDEFPKEVPVVSCSEFDLCAERPDVIFIHNPYDEYNHMTSVHPSFYALNLKKFTRELVYVPYFVNLNDVPEHFCVSPGTMYSDLVAVQSEKVKNTYIRVFKQFEEEGNRKDFWGVLERKFLALGSPKIDKAITVLEEHYEIPEEWRKMLSNKNGERKKIVFLNTTLVYILKYEKQYLVHLREVFDVFKTYEDILLLWRPHPLSDATFSSMKKELQEEYRQLIDYYKRNSIGIYDDNPDLYCAISLCDVCYGDNSSVLALVWAQKKPVMYRNVVKTFPVDEPKKGNFEDAIHSNKDGIKKRLLIETKKYSLKNFLYDIQCEERYTLMKRFYETHDIASIEEFYLNFGCAGRKIYNAAKKHLQRGE